MRLFVLSLMFDRNVISALGYMIYAINVYRIWETYINQSAVLKVCVNLLSF